MVEAAGIEPAKWKCGIRRKRGFIGLFAFCLGNEWKQDGVYCGGNWWNTLVGAG
jgi:hypothetical protein